MKSLSIFIFVLLNFGISLRDDSGFNEKFLSLLLEKNTETSKELEFTDFVSIYPTICTFKG